MALTEEEKAFLIKIGQVADNDKKENKAPSTPIEKTEE